MRLTNDKRTTTRLRVNGFAAVSLPICRDDPSRWATMLGQVAVGGIA